MGAGVGWGWSWGGGRGLRSSWMGGWGWGLGMGLIITRDSTCHDPRVRSFSTSHGSGRVGSAEMSRVLVGRVGSVQRF